jgi:hypothetical protein
MGGGVGWRSRDFAVGSAGARPENFRCWVLGSWRWVTGSAVGSQAPPLGGRRGCWVGVGSVWGRWCPEASGGGEGPDTGAVGVAGHTRRGGTAEDYCGAARRMASAKAHLTPPGRYRFHLTALPKTHGTGSGRRWSAAPRARSAATAWVISSEASGGDGEASGQWRRGGGDNKVGGEAHRASRGSSETARSKTTKSPTCRRIRRSREPPWRSNCAFAHKTGRISRPNRARTAARQDPRGSCSEGI